MSFKIHIYRLNKYRFLLAFLPLFFFFTLLPMSFLDAGNTVEHFAEAESVFSIDTARGSEKKTLASVDTPVGWYVVVENKISSGAQINEVYCGYKPGEGDSQKWFPAAPSFQKVKVRVVNPKDNNEYGHVVLGGQDSSAVYTLMFRNAGDSMVSVETNVFKSFGLAEGIGVSLFDPHTKKRASVDTISLKPGESIIRYLFLGSSSFYHESMAKIAQQDSKISAVRHITSSQAMIIDYSIGWQGKQNVCFTLHDIQGHLLWKSQKYFSQNEGNRQLVLSPNTMQRKMLGSGFYILRMITIDNESGVRKVFSRTLSFTR